MTHAIRAAILRGVSRQPYRTSFYRRLAVLLPLALLLYAALAGFVLADNAANRGVTYTPGAQLIAWADVPQLGVNLYGIQNDADPANVTRTLEMARDLGARFTRIQMPWEDVEIHARGDFEDRRDPAAPKSAWQKYDFILAEAARMGIAPIVRLDRPPAWARQRARHARVSGAQGREWRSNRPARRLCRLRSFRRRSCAALQRPAAFHPDLERAKLDG